MQSQWDSFPAVKALLDKKRAGVKIAAMILCSGIDYLMHWDTQVLNAWYKKFSINKTPDYSDGLQSVEDFLSLIDDMLVQGRGIDANIKSYDLCRFIESSFCIDGYAVAGTAAQGACALASMGFPAALHTTVLTEKLKALMAYPKLLTVSNGRFRPVAEDRTPVKDAYAPHFVFQYGKGSEIIVNGKKKSATASNRIILPHDSLNMDVPVNEEYFSALLEEADNVSSLVISGFHAIKEGDIFRKRIETVSEWLHKLRRKNKKTVFYFEGAAYYRPEFINIIYKELGSVADILGFNEDELKEIACIHDMDFMAGDYNALFEALRVLCNRYNPGLGIVYHTKDFSMYYGKKTDLDIEAGLHIGNLMAASKATTGKYPKTEALQECFEIPYSKEGQRLLYFVKNCNSGATAFAAPGRVLDHPKNTVGLGDTFTAGMQIGFM